ncbi:MAG: tetratricopeptide repeat protein [Myxococcota bacterium]
MQGRVRAVLPSLLIVLLTGLTYAGSLDGGFVSDDLRGVRDNPLLRSLDLENLGRIATSFDAANYMPLTVLSLALDHWIFGGAPWGYHATALALHVLCALVLHRLLLQLELGAGAALAVALLWAVHPVQVESVAWISERKNVLSTLLMLLAFRSYLGWSRHGGAWRFLGLLALYVLSLLSKMTTMVLPALCLSYELCFRGRLGRRELLASLPLFAGGVLVGAYNLVGSRVHAVAYHGGSFLVSALSSAVVVFRYLGNVLVPTRLSIYYDVPLRASLLDPTTALAVLGLTAGAVAALYGLWRRVREGFWLLWFSITLLPMLNLIPFPALMQDRYLYVPLVGPLVGLTLLAHAARRRGVPAPLLGAVAAAAVGASALLSVQRVEVFDSPLAHWRDWATQIVYLPSDPPRRIPEFEARVRALREALHERPRSAVLHANLGALYFQRGLSAEAVRELRIAARLAPGHRQILATLGRALAEAGRPQEGERILSRAAALDPHAFPTWRALARLRLQLGDLQGAREALRALERIRPADSSLGRSWASLRDSLAQLETEGAAQHDRP